MINIEVNPIVNDDSSDSSMSLDLDDIDTDNGDGNGDDTGGGDGNGDGNGDNTGEGAVTPWVLPESLVFNMTMGASVQLEKTFEVKIGSYDTSSITGYFFPKATWHIEGSSIPIDFELKDFFSLDQEQNIYSFEFGKTKNLTLNVNNVNLLLAGTYEYVLNLQIVQNPDFPPVQEFNIPITINVLDAGDVTHNLSNNLNWCLDKNLSLEVFSNLASFVKIHYEIVRYGKVYEFENEYAVFNNHLKVEFAVPIQPYVYLSEEDIENYFSNLMLDMEPAEVTIKLKLLSSSFQFLNEINLGTFKFHAGSPENLIPYDTVVERSLNYNTCLPLVYQYPNQDVTFTFENTTKTFNKQQYSSIFNIFQMMFLNQYHFCKPYGGGFSSGFSSGFNSSILAGNDDLYSYYKEAYINTIESNYTIKGYNFPIQIESFNVIWIDENNHFNGITFTGVRKDTDSYKFMVNNFAKDHRNAKAETNKTSKVVLNTGFLLKSEKPLVDALIRSKRCWIFKDNPSERVEAICVQKKKEAYNTMEQYISYNIEFKVYE